jgi:A/G-specific adenine glycosylase
VKNYPRKAKKAAARQETAVVCVLRDDGDEYVVFKRPATGLLANLLEFPSFEASSIEKKADLAEMLSSQLSLKVDSLKERGSVSHRFSHIDQGRDSPMLKAKITYS